MNAITAYASFCIVASLLGADDATAFTAANIQSAYTAGDAAALDKILSRWAKESSETLQHRIRSSLEITSAVEDIYTAICEKDFPAEKSEKYFVVPETIMVIVVPDDFSKYDDPKTSFYAERSRSQAAVAHSERITIHDFAPKALAKRERILLSDEAHSQELLRFLAMKADVFVEDRLRLDNRSEESKRRYKFLQAQLPVEEGAWGLGWSCLSEPAVGRVFVNGKLDEARVSVSRGHGGEILAVKKNGKGEVGSEPNACSSFYSVTVVSFSERGRGDIAWCRAPGTADRMDQELSRVPSFCRTLSACDPNGNPDPGAALCELAPG